MQFPKYLLILLLTYCSATKADVTFDITNSEGGDIWIGILGNGGKPTLNNGGFILKPGQTTTVSLPDNGRCRFWARTWCDASTQHCLTGDCGNKLECNGAGGAPPTTLVEINLKAYGGKDYYDISLVNGYNIAGSIEPIEGQTTGDKRSCKKAGCAGNISGQCPNELKVVNNGNTIGCQSACDKFHTDEYCCRGNSATPDTCHATNYSKFFKGICPNAYSYAYDDSTSLYTCKAGHYKIVFGG